MKKLYIVCACFTVFNLFSQEIKKYTWAEKPSFEAIPDMYKNQQAVVLFDHRWMHTRVGGYAFANFCMNHFAVKINTQDAINKYNKVKAEDNGYVRELRDFHCRIIKPNGDVKVLPQTSIVETVIDKVKSYVFEGVEVGDILEYYFILKENPSSYGVEVFQKDIPVMDAWFKVTYSGVDFSIYSHSEFKASNADDLLYFEAKNIPAINDESYTNGVRNLVKIIYNLTVKGQQDFYLWNKLMNTYFRKPSFTYFSKLKARDFITSLALDGLTTDEKLIKLDTHIKENFEFVTGGEKAKKVKNLGTEKQKLTASDVFDLYGFTLRESKIPYLVVVGIDRDYDAINPDRLVKPLPHEYCYYIPETKKYISPYERFLPYGEFALFGLQNTTGISYNPKEDLIENLKYPEAPSNFTVSNVSNILTLSDDLTTAKLEKTVSNNGIIGQIDRYYAKYYKENEEEKEMIDYLKQRNTGNLDVGVEKYVFENQEFKNSYSNTPFVTKLTLNIKESITENAGNLLLVNIGKIVGKQNNLYQETTRLNDVELNYNKIFRHNIIFNIPEGYAVESYADLVIDKSMNFDKAKASFFKSTVKVEDKTVVIAIEEQYNSIFYPKESYQEYRKIINAAADFAKATLVLKQVK